MSEDTKQQLQIVLDLLRKSLIDNGVSMGAIRKENNVF